MTSKSKLPTKTPKPELAREAAQWWADTLRDEDRTQDNGDYFGSSLATYNRKQQLETITDEQIDQFETALRDEIESKEYTGMSCFIGVDYGPDATLASALDAAGIEPNLSILPWKTTMWIEDERITVSEGRKADRVELYSTDDWPPTIHEIQVEEVFFSIELRPFMIENAQNSLHDAIADRLTVDEYQGYDYEIRRLGPMDVRHMEETTNKHDSDVFEATVACEATVFVSQEYIEENTGLLRSGPSDEILVADAFEKFTHLGVQVHEVGIRGSSSTEAW